MERGGMGKGREEEGEVRGGEAREEEAPQLFWSGTAPASRRD